MNKKQLGQYFTKKNLWLMPQIKDFIISSKCTIAYDPFAGAGDLLNCSKEYGITNTIGLDIDSSLNWNINDSLKNIPHVDNAIIITNPPYLTNYSAKRKKIFKGLEDYFKKYTDLYQLAVLKMLEAQDHVVAIIPETFINSNFLNKVKQRLNSITILLENPFEDTENPVCVVCFDNNSSNNRKTEIYVGDKYINELSYIKSKSLIPTKKYNIIFNSTEGKLAIRAVDMPSIDKKIKFMSVSDLDYDLKNIKISSRLITVVEIPEINVDINILAKTCNNILNNYRKITQDVTLSPFKGNAKDGSRRRRLDYKTARAIIEQALDSILKEEKVMITNKELMKYCLDNPSPIRDRNYDVDKELVIIPRTSIEDNELSENCKKLINLFTTIATLNAENDFSKDDELVERINNIFLKVKYMNFFPFNQYLQTHNFTYSIYKKDLSFAEQKQIIKEYINDRHFMYLEHGYSNTIYQVLCDSYAHKRKGDAGTRKIRIQAENHGIKHYDFKNDNYYLSPDKGDEKQFLEIINKQNIGYSYYIEKNAKLPDLFLKINEKYVFVEHKNIKEGGGHQNNVIVEIKDFINESDKNVFYVSYVDGKFFKTTFDLNYKKDGTLKKDVTNKNINEIFESNKRSYIVNASGFDKFLDELLKK